MQDDPSAGSTTAGRVSSLIRRGSKKRRDTIGSRPPYEPVSKWRLIVFVLFICLSAALGYLFKFPWQEPPGGAAGIQLGILNFYTTDPHARARIQVTIKPSYDIPALGQRGPTTASVSFAVQPSTPGANVEWAIAWAGLPMQSGIQTVAVTTPLAPSNGPGYVLLIKGDSSRITPANLPAATRMSDSDPALFPVANITLNDLGTSIFSSSDFSIQLPRIEVISTGQYPTAAPFILNTTSQANDLSADNYLLTKPYRAVSALYLPALKDPNLASKGLSDVARTDPATYVDPVPPGVQATPYFAPASYSVAEILTDGESMLQDARINTLVPADSKARGFDLDWESDTTVSPEVSATKNELIDRRSAYDFYSGIAFATAAAALIAVVQELPKRWRPLAWWWRKKPKPVKVVAAPSRAPTWEPEPPDEDPAP